MKTIQQIDKFRIKKVQWVLYCFQIQQNFNTFVKSAMTLMEHIFNDHSSCDSLWYYEKEMEGESNMMIHCVDDYVSHIMNQTI